MNSEPLYTQLLPARPVLFKLSTLETSIDRYRKGLPALTPLVYLRYLLLVALVRLESHLVAPQGSGCSPCSPDHAGDSFDIWTCSVENPSSSTPQPRSISSPRSTLSSGSLSQWFSSANSQTPEYTSFGNFSPLEYPCTHPFQ